MPKTALQKKVFHHVIESNTLTEKKIDFEIETNYKDNYLPKL